MLVYYAQLKQEVAYLISGGISVEVVSEHFKEDGLHLQFQPLEGKGRQIFV